MAALVFVFGLLSPALRAQAPTAGPATPVGALKKLSLDELFDIDVTSVLRRPEKIQDAPSAIQAISDEDIRRFGATSIPDALRLADNLEVAQKSPHAWGISARGFNTDLANKLLVLMDGRTVYTPLYSGVFWDVQDYLLPDLDQIEVVSGPGGTLWGANAVNGVINITTKSAADTQGGLVEAGGGTQLRDFAGFRYGGILAPKVFYRVYGKYSGWDQTETENGQDAHDGWTMKRGGFRVDSLAVPQTTMTLQGDLYSGDEDETTGGTAKVSGGNMLGRWSRSFSPDSDLRVQAYYDRTHLLNPVAKSAFAPAGAITDDLGTYDLDVQHRFAIAQHHEIVWGFGYRFTRDVVQNTPGLAFVPDHLGQNLYSAFAQDRIALGRTLSLTLGSKLEHNDYTGLEAEPSARLQWHAAPGEMAWAAVSRAVRTPSRIDRDLREPSPPPAILEGSSDFTSETLVAYEAGYRAQFAQDVALSASLFYNDYRDLRSLGFTPATILPLLFQNNLQGETHGLELTATYRPKSWWRLRGGYDLLEEHLHVKPGRTDLNNALNETSDPQQQWSVRSSLDLPGAVEFDAALRWVDTLHNNNNGQVGTVPAYYDLDLRLGWHPVPALELSIAGQNLLHARHPEFGLTGPGREQVERGVYGKATWRF